MTNIRAPARTLVLTNPDLLHYYIFAFVSAPLLPGLRTRYLARCTTVCRTFYKPAIKILWRKLDTFLPLWQLLAPPDADFQLNSLCELLSADRDKLSECLYEVISARSYEDPILWDRFLWHAARVRDIGHRTYRSPEINAAHFLLAQTVLMQNGGKTVLPLLHSMHWEDRAPTDGSLIPFFPPTLRSASFSLRAGPNDERAHTLLLRRLHESCPYLEKVEINVCYREAGKLNVEPPLAWELLSFDRLRDIQVSRFAGPSTFLDLVTKPNLTRLEILDVSGLWSASSPPILVHDLRELSVMSTGSALVGLFDLVRFRALESVTMDIAPSFDAEKEIEDILKAFYNAVPGGTLRSLTLYITGLGIDARRTPKGLRDLVRPILPLREIRSFKFYSEEFHSSIQDADIEALARAWPMLERLSFDSLLPSYPDALSIYAFHYIHAHCPNLRELDMPVLSIRFPAVGVHTIRARLDRSSPSRPHPLRRLGISSAYVHAPGYACLGGGVADEHAEAFARYLLELFPALDTEEHGRWWDKAASRPKEEVARHQDGRKVLAHMYSIRASERDRF